MAARAQEARKPAGLTEPKIKDLPAASTAIETPPTGNNVSATGKNSPPTTGAGPSAQKPDHATGLERAVERLQQNAVKSPEAAGLRTHWKCCSVIRKEPVWLTRGHDSLLPWA